MRVHGGRAALDVMDLAAFVGDDQGPLELAHVLGVDPEVRLERHVHLHAGRDVDERPARPDRRVEGRELVVVRRDELAEVLLHEVGVLAQRRVHVAEQHTLARQVVPVAVVDDFAFVLGGDPGEVLTLGLGDPELVVGGLDRVGKLVPGADLLVDRLYVIENVVEIDPGHVPAPGRHRPALEVPERLQATVRHPLRLALHPGHLPHDVLVQALLGLEDVIVLDIAPAQLVAAQVKIFSCIGHRASLRRRFLLRR